MKKVFTTLAIFLSVYAAQAQNLGVGTNTPNASAALDVTSTSQGILVPRMTTTARNNISSPAKGLMVYDSTLNSFYYHNGTAWSAVGTASATSIPNGFYGHTLNNSSAVFYITPLTNTASSVPNPLNSILFPANTTFTVNFYSYDDEALIFELLEVTPVTNGSTYTASGAALASATTAASSGTAVTTGFSYTATAGKLLTIRVKRPDGATFSTNSGIFTTFSAN